MKTNSVSSIPVAKYHHSKANDNFDPNNEPSIYNPLSPQDLTPQGEGISLKTPIGSRDVEDRLNKEIVDLEINSTEEKFTENQNLTTDMLRGMIALTSKEYVPVKNISGLKTVLESNNNNIKFDRDKLTLDGIDIRFIKTPQGYFEALISGDSTHDCLAGLKNLRKMLRNRNKGNFFEATGKLEIDNEIYFFPTVQSEQDIIKVEVDPKTGAIALKKDYDKVKQIRNHISNRHEMKKDDAYVSSTAKFLCFCQRGGFIENQNLQSTFYSVLSDQWQAIIKEASESGNLVQKAEQAVANTNQITVNVEQQRKAELDTQLQEMQQQIAIADDQLKQTEAPLKDANNRRLRLIDPTKPHIEIKNKFVAINKLRRKLFSICEEQNQLRLANQLSENPDENDPQNNQIDESQLNQLKDKISQLKQNIESLSAEIGESSDMASGNRNASLHARINQQLNQDRMAISRNISEANRTLKEVENLLCFAEGIVNAQSARNEFCKLTKAVNFINQKIKANELQIDHGDEKDRTTPKCVSNYLNKLNLWFNHLEKIIKDTISNDLPKQIQPVLIAMVKAAPNGEKIQKIKLFLEEIKTTLNCIEQGIKEINQGDLCNFLKTLKITFTDKVDKAQKINEINDLIYNAEWVVDLVIDVSDMNTELENLKQTIQNVNGSQEWQISQQLHDQLLDISRQIQHTSLGDDESKFKQISDQLDEIDDQMPHLEAQITKANLERQFESLQQEIANMNTFFGDAVCQQEKLIGKHNVQKKLQEIGNQIYELQSKLESINHLLSKQNPQNITQYNQQLAHASKQAPALRQNIESLGKEIGLPSDVPSMDKKASLYAQINQQLEMDRETIRKNMKELNAKASQLQNQMQQLPMQAQAAKTAAENAGNLMVGATALQTTTQAIQKLAKDNKTLLLSVQQTTSSINPDSLQISNGTTPIDAQNKLNELRQKLEKIENQLKEQMNTVRSVQQNADSMLQIRKNAATNRIIPDAIRIKINEAQSAEEIDKYVKEAQELYSKKSQAKLNIIKLPEEISVTLRNAIDGAQSIAEINEINVFIKNISEIIERTKERISESLRKIKFRIDEQLIGNKPNDKIRKTESEALGSIRQLSFQGGKIDAAIVQRQADQILNTLDEKLVNISNEAIGNHSQSIAANFSEESDNSFFGKVWKFFTE